MSSVLSWSFIVYSVNGRFGNTPSSLMEKSQDFGVFFNLKWVFEDICIASTLTNCYGYMYVYYRAGSIIAQSKHNVMYLSCSWHLTTKQPFFHDFFLSLSIWKRKQSFYSAAKQQISWVVSLLRSPLTFFWPGAPNYSAI